MSRPAVVGRVPGRGEGDARVTWDLGAAEEAADFVGLQRQTRSAGAHDADLRHLVERIASSVGGGLAQVRLIDGPHLFVAYGTLLEGVSVPRRGSFCASVVDEGTELVVLDAAEHPDFREDLQHVGRPGWRFYAGVPLRAASGRVIGALCVADTEPRAAFPDADVTRLREGAALIGAKFENQRLDAAHRVSRVRFESIAASSPDSIVCLDEGGRILFWNPAAERLLGRGGDDLLRLDFRVVIPGPFGGSEGDGWTDAEPGSLRARVGPTAEWRLRRGDGSEIDVEVSRSSWSEAGRPRSGLILRDISERRAHQADMFRLAHFDALTDLPNRALLTSRIARSGEDGGAGAVLMLDLDHFKEVNDTRGHSVGDTLLRLVAGRLGACIRPYDTAARLGGDEFAVWLDRVADPADVGAAAERIIETLSEPYTIDDQTVVVGVSVGIALTPEHGRDAEELLAHADMALYRAKAEGRHLHRVFTPELRDTVLRRRSLSAELRGAVERGEFELFYQPQVRLSDGGLTGAEALIRWRHPERGLVAPGEFLSVLESGRHAAAVGDWVLRTACVQAAAWRSEVRTPFRIGVNLFAAQFRRGDLVARVRETLADTRLPPEALELEITENIVLSDDAHVLGALRALREDGIQIAFDDYGTGYASLSLLKRFPLTRLKIDRSFVGGMEGSQQDATIVRAILQLGHGFKLDVIAEGIETEAQHARLKGKGCREGQGYLFGKPMPAAEFTARHLGAPGGSSGDLEAA